MIRTINLKGTPVLYTSAIQCMEPASTDLTTAVADSIWNMEVMDLITDLKDTAENIANNCLGLAANQIWSKEPPCPAVFVMRWPDPKEVRQWSWKAIINPVIKGTGPTLKLEEGCLSFPDKPVRKSRSKNVILTYQSEFDSTRTAVKFLQHQGWFSHIIQHEMDHLLGKTIRK